MPVTIRPAVGREGVAKSQVLLQKHIVLDNELRWGDVVNEPRILLNTRGLPRVRVQVFLYPEYDRGEGGIFLARNYLQWRVMGLFSPTVPLPVLNVLPQYTKDFGSEGAYMPMTTPQLLPPAIPISVDLELGASQAIAVQFDTSAGTSQNCQGLDLILVTITASG